MKILLHLSDSSLPWDLLNSVEYMLLCARHTLRRLPWWFSGKEAACNVVDPGSIPHLGRFPREGTVNLQYSCLKNSKDRQAWRAAVHGIAKSQTQLSN